jgi:RNA polymerase sigma-70 factor (ECF subfamily)
MSENAEVIEDRLLASRAAAGSEAALATLYDRYSDPLFAFIYHRLNGKRADAEDVFQDTWLAALHSLRAFRGQTKLFFWLCGIARHKIADHYPRRALVLDAGNPAMSGERLSTLVDQAPLTEDLVARIDTRTLVVKALALLPEEYRAALLARYVNGQSVGEIAEDLGKTYKAAESLLSRARTRMREALALAEREDADE